MSGAVAQRARREAEARLSGQSRRLAHVRGVAAAAERLSRRFDAQTADCLVAAAWLHDIGYVPSVRRTGFHPLDGAVFVRSAGFGELVASLVAFHTGAHVEASERGVSGLAAFSEPPRKPLSGMEREKSPLAMAKMMERTCSKASMIWPRSSWVDR